ALRGPRDLQETWVVLEHQRDGRAALQAAVSEELSRAVGALVELTKCDRRSRSRHDNRGAIRVPRRDLTGIRHVVAIPSISWSDSSMQSSYRSGSGSISRSAVTDSVNSPAQLPARWMRPTPWGVGPAPYGPTSRAPQK